MSDLIDPPKGNPQDKKYLSNARTLTNKERKKLKKELKELAGKFPPIKTAKAPKITREEATRMKRIQVLFTCLHPST